MTGPWQPATPDSTQRYYVHEYVCHGGTIQQAPAEGTVLVQDVLAQRPDTCVYAILVHPLYPAEVIVADLAMCSVASDGWVALGRHWKFPSIEAARAATVMHYGEL